MRRSGVYIVNEPEDEENKENGGPKHIFINRMSDENEKEAPLETPPQTPDVPVEIEPQPQPQSSDPILKPEKVPSVYR